LGCCHSAKKTVSSGRSYPKKAQGTLGPTPLGAPECGQEIGTGLRKVAKMNYTLSQAHRKGARTLQNQKGKTLSKQLRRPFFAKRQVKEIAEKVEK